MSLATPAYNDNARSQESIVSPASESSPLVQYGFEQASKAGPYSNEVEFSNAGLEWDQRPDTELNRELDGTDTDEERDFSPRKVIGGSLQDKNGGQDQLQTTKRSVPRVAFDVAATCLGVGPLVVPHAMQLTGLAIGLPMLFIIAALSWFSHTSLAVEARYVGASSLNKLSHSVFPTRLIGQFASEILVDLFVLFVAMGRAIASLYCASSLFAAFASTAMSRLGFLQNTAWLSIFIVTFHLLVTLTGPARNRLLANQQWSLLHTAASAIYMLALTIIGIRVHRLHVYSADALPTIQTRRFSWNFYASLREEAMGFSIWGGIAILLFSLVSQQSSFEHQRSLRETSKTQIKRNSGVPLPNLKVVKQHGWETSSFFGMFGVSLVLLAWALVGYLAVPLPDGYGQPGNILSALPVDDVWFAFARLLLFVTLVSGLPATLRPARRCVKRLLLLPTRFSGRKENSRTSRYHGRTNSRASELEMESSDSTDDDAATAPSSLQQIWLGRVASLIAHVVLIIVTLATVRNDQDLASLVEITGCLGSTFVGLIIPATFFVVLFHIRKARNIFVTDTRNSGAAQDDLLMKKEAQLQRRLSGRRLHQDFIVFAGLLPLGIVIFIRGCIALASVNAVT